MKKTLIACVISVFLVTGCGPKGLSAEDQKLTEQLKTELAQTDSDISLATKDAQQQSAGLVSELNASRLNILQENKQMLQQKIDAIAAGDKNKAQPTSGKRDVAGAAQAKQKIDEMQAGIAETEKEAAKLTDGVILELTQAGLAAQKQTLAKMRQLYLMDQYGLPAPTADNSAAAQEKTAPKKVTDK